MDLLSTRRAIADPCTKHFVDPWKRFTPRSEKALLDRLRHRIIVLNIEKVEVDEETVQRLIGVAYQKTKHRFDNQPLNKQPVWTLIKRDGEFQLIAANGG